MIGYCPIEFDETPPPPVNPQVKRKIVIEEPMATTECNYLVMFFIVGVIALAGMDAVSK
jgi:hypothetical protein